MINPLAIATRGRIAASAKKTLTLAVVGWLFYSSLIEPIVPTVPIRYVDERVESVEEIEEVPGKRKHELRLLQDDEEILTIIKIWVQCQK